MATVYLRSRLAGVAYPFVPPVQPFARDRIRTYIYPFARKPSKEARTLIFLQRGIFFPLNKIFIH